MRRSKRQQLELLQHRADRSEWLSDSQWPANAVRPLRHPSFTGQALARAGARLLGAAGRDLPTEREQSGGLDEGGIRRSPKEGCRLSAKPGQQRNDARVVAAAWRATGSPTATWSDPLDVGGVPRSCS